MKNVVLATALSTVLAASFSAQAGINSKVSFAGDLEFAGFCKAAVQDDVDLFKRTLNKNAVKLTGTNRGALEYVLDGNKLTCDGQDLQAFAQNRNAQNLLAFFAAQQQEEQQEQTRVAYVGDKRFAGFCKAAINDSVALFNRTLRRQVGYIAASRDEALDMVKNAENVSCSGKGIEEFSKERGAEKLTAYLQSTSA